MSRTAAFLLAALGGLALAPAADAAGQWKWREANGRIVYSDRPPPGHISEKAILQRPPGMVPQAVPPSPKGPSLVPGTPAVVTLPASAATSGVPGTEPELEARRRKEAEAKEAQAQAEAAKLAAAKAENCARARGQLKVLDDGVRIARTNEKGEREILDDKARAAEQSRLRAVIASDCAPR